MENQTYSFQDFVDIIKRLRADDGCPWDREQTHQSLKKCLTEECNEVLEGIEIYESTGDWDNLCEELGDVLLQVVMHSVIAQEEGIFNIDDVIQGISEKMVRRHPHVFGNGRADNASQVRMIWEEIKAQEKKEKEARKKEKQ